MSGLQPPPTSSGMEETCGLFWSKPSAMAIGGGLETLATLVSLVPTIREGV